MDLPYEVTITVKGSDFAYVISSLDEINRRIFESGPICTGGGKSTDGEYTFKCEAPKS